MLTIEKKPVVINIEHLVNFITDGKNEDYYLKEVTHTGLQTLEQSEEQKLKWDYVLSTID